jgi:hypothetical protein
MGMDGSSSRREGGRSAAEALFDVRAAGAAAAAAAAHLLNAGASANPDPKPISSNEAGQTSAQTLAMRELRVAYKGTCKTRVRREYL